MRGLTWDHPHRYKALERVVAGPLHTGATTTSTVVWERQSLPDFEARPLRYVADDYDLVVIDHPSLGESVADDSSCRLTRSSRPPGFGSFANQPWANHRKVISLVAGSGQSRLTPPLRFRSSDQISWRIGPEFGRPQLVRPPSGAPPYVSAARMLC